LKLRTKITLGIAAAIFASFVVVEYQAYSDIKSGVVENLHREARNIRGVLMAMRATYEREFLENKLPLNDQNVRLLPAHSISRISKDFKGWSKAGVTFSNVSDKPLNPANMAAPEEMEAIRFFREHPEEKERMASYTDASGAMFYLYSTPLWMEEYCLNCHGDKAKVPPGLLTIFKSSPEYEVGELRGILNVRFPMGEIEALTTQRLWEEFFLHILGFVIVFFLISWLFSETVIKKLERVTRISNNFAAGDYQKRAAIPGNDEIAELSVAFDSMADAIADREAVLRDSELRIRTIIESARDGIIIVGEDGIIRHLNPAAGWVFGYEESEITNQPLVSLIPEELRALHEAGFNRLVQSSNDTTIEKGVLEVTGLNKNGDHIPMELSLSQMQSGAERLFIGMVRDITRRKQAEDALRNSEERIRLLLEASGEGIIGTDTNGIITSCNPAAAKLLGYTDATVLVGEAMHPLIHHSKADGTSFPEGECGICLAYKKGVSSRAEDTVFWRKDGSSISVEYHSHPIFRAEQLMGAVVTFADITERKAEQEQVWRQANYDGLTGLPNRHLFYDRLEQAMEHGKREQYQLALLYIDLDGFKEVNDQLGHEAGDELLKEAANRLSKSVRISDITARMGGDEFTVILLPIREFSSIGPLASTILEQLSTPYSINGRELQLSGSIGIAIYPKDGETIAELLKHADVAMYSAKEAGKNTIRFYSQ